MLDKSLDTIIRKSIFMSLCQQKVITTAWLPITVTTYHKHLYIQLGLM